MLALLVGGVTWWTARPDVVWSTTLPGGPYNVLDWDDSRVLVASSRRVVVLAREDGTVLQRVELDRYSDQQGWLRPGGGFVVVTEDERLQSWSDVPIAVEAGGAGPPSPDVEVSARQDQLRLVAATREHAVVVDGFFTDAPDLRAISLEDGATTWRTRVADVLPMFDPGKKLDAVGVVPVVLPGGRTTTLLSVEDGTPVAEVPAVDRRGGSAHVWGESAILGLGDSLWLASPQRVVELEAPLAAGGLAILPQAGGVVTLFSEARTYGVDLATGTVSPLPDADDDYRYESDDSSVAVTDRTVALFVDDVLTGVDRGTGEVLFTLDVDGFPLGQGRDAALIAREVTGPRAWIARRMNSHLRSDVLAVQVVDRSGDLHGRFLTDIGNIGGLEDWAVLDGREAVVTEREIALDPADDQSRVVLLGR